MKIPGAAGRPMMLVDGEVKVAVERVFENTDLLVVIKPHGSLSTPGRDPDDTRPCLGRELQNEVGTQIFPVHRLDFEVSGLVMFAKSKAAHTAAQQWFEGGVVKKTYQALSRAGGNPKEFADWVLWRSKLVRGKRRSFEAPHGKEALTEARLLKLEGDLWRWELRPLTGRSHQLRFEMSKHGFPILGDELYGGPSAKPGWIALRAVELNFVNIPDSGRFGLPLFLKASDLEAAG